MDGSDIIAPLVADVVGVELGQDVDEHRARYRFTIKIGLFAWRRLRRVGPPERFGHEWREIDPLVCIAPDIHSPINSRWRHNHVAVAFHVDAFTEEVPAGPSHSTVPVYQR